MPIQAINIILYFFNNFQMLVHLVFHNPKHFIHPYVILQLFSKTNQTYLQHHFHFLRLIQHFFLHLMLNKMLQNYPFLNNLLLMDNLNHLILIQYFMVMENLFLLQPNLEILLHKIIYLINLNEHLKQHIYCIKQPILLYLVCVINILHLFLLFMALLLQMQHVI